MAQLAKTSYPAPEFVIGSDTSQYLAAERAVLDELHAASDNLRPGQIVGGLLRFPAADGYALYVVSKETPLTLQHVPIGDAWTAAPETIRGLRRADVVVRLEQQRRMAAIFGRK